MTDSKNSNNVTPASNDAVTLPPYTVTRRVLLQANVNELSEYERSDTKLCKRLGDAVHGFSVWAFLLNAIPVLKWVPRYSLRENLLGDLMSGVTVAVMHIPQGMAYGLLAGVTPSAGLYMAVFPTLAYFVFGTSRHISVGTLSVISVMVLQLVQAHSTPPKSADAAVANSTQLAADDLIRSVETGYTASQVVTACAFVCGIQMVLMSVLQLGNLASLLSESLVSGFTTGAAVHVFASQLKDMFGVKITRHQGYFQVIHTFVDFCRQLPNTNLYTLAITGIVITFMILMNELVKPHASKLCRFPIPAELVAVLGGTLASRLLALRETYGVNPVGGIPLGFPAPELPPVELMWTVAIEAIPITIVSYSVTISMAMILAKKQNYEVRPNQELFAMGVSNLVGGLFACIPNGTSLSRSLIQELTGGRTQFASVVSAFLITLILLWIAPVFEVLPRCVLSGIIVVALKGMYLQVCDLPRFHREGPLNSLTWLVTFAAVVAVDVDVGLVAGICVSLLTIYVKGWRTSHCQLGVVPDTGLYVDLRTHPKARPVAGVCIFRFVGAVNFAFAGSFKRALYETTSVTHKQLRRASQMSVGGSGGGEQQKLLQMRSVVVDLSGVTHMDVAAMKVCREIEGELELLGVRLLLAAPNDAVWDAIRHAQMLGVGEFVVLPSVHDAVLFATQKSGAVATA